MEAKDLTVQENVVELMRSSKSEEEWDNNCDKVKKANGGYPSWWFGAIILSGVGQDTIAKYGQQKEK